MSDDLTKQAEGYDGFVKSCIYDPNLASVPYQIFAAVAGAVAMQNPIARRLHLTEREQDPTELLEIADTLRTILIMGEYDEHMYWDRLDPFLQILATVSHPHSRVLSREARDAKTRQRRDRRLF